MPKKVTIHHKDGSSAEVYTIDAREAVSAHPNEWSYKPWDAPKSELPKRDEQKAAEKAKG